MHEYEQVTEGVFRIRGKRSNMYLLAEETPALIDTGMSTVHEVVVANAIGMKVAGLSCITNMAAGISGPHLSHQEVIDQTQKSAPVMSKLLDAFLARLV